ncbi:MAG: cyclic nucleotide-binding domain-containing protein [Desulfobacter sp.]|nr:MAG: cyclic nucleotide-binding domain-containing protein [Desulfobacter sp.]
MVEIADLKKINFMKDLPEDVLEKVAAVAQLENFGEEAILLRQGQEQSLIYMLVSGKIFINCRAASGKALTLDELTAGQTCGLSSLLENSPSTYTAICAEESAVITLSSAQLLQVFESDYSIGYRFMEKVVEKFKNRMGKHTQRFMDALASHPAIG